MLGLTLELLDVHAWNMGVQGFEVPRKNLWIVQEERVRLKKNGGVSV